jgi:hypothetical protein
MAGAISSAAEVRLASAQNSWGNTTIWFENLPVGDLDEFSREFAICADGSFHHSPTDEAQRFGLKEGLWFCRRLSVGR